MQTALLDILANIKTVVAEKYQDFVQEAPFILGAIGVFLIGLLIAQLASKVIIAMSEKLRIELLAEKIGLSHFLEKHEAQITSSHVIAKTFKGYLIFVFFIEATKVARLYQVSDFLDEVKNYIPEVIVAVLIMLVGIRMGNVMSGIIKTSFSFTKSSTANVLGIAAEYTILTFAALAALSQLEIADILVQTLFIGFIAMLTLAGGLAFGLGGKDVVKELLEAIKKVEIKEYKKELEEERAERKEKKKK